MEKNNKTKRGLSSDDARKVRKQGHDDALEFAKLIGQKEDYKNDNHAKKDVFDPSGDTHSLKSGKKKWQIFLYGITRFQQDDAWQVMDGIGELLVNCIEAFPKSFYDYKDDKLKSKELLRPHMRELANKLKDKRRLRAFFNKSMFNGGEVNYLTVKHEGKFHVFLNRDVIDVIGENIEVANSVARNSREISDQKVLFKYKGTNLAEVEMRNDSVVHYREIRFNMLKLRMLELLFDNLELTSKFSDSVYVYGNASKKFGRWEK